MVKKFFFFIIFIYSLTLPVFAQDNPDYEKQYNELSNKIAELSKASLTLSNQIKLIDTQIIQTQLKIKQTTYTIATLKKDIIELGGKIGNLDVSLNELTAVYINQIVQNYKLQKRIPAYTLFASSNFNNFFENYKYLSRVQKNSQDTLVNMETTRTTLDQEKQIKAEKQKTLEGLEKSLAKQNNDLANQKATKNSLLSITQKQLADAQSQLSSMRNFSKVGGSTCLSASPGGGSDGWFYSQRDPRWCNQFIGLSRDTIGEVGCYISTVSMIWKKYGFEMTPASYASNSTYFLGATAWMTNPAPPPGYSYKRISYNKDVLDSELKAGRPVIAQMYMKNVAGMHFIVIKSGSNGQYQIHDPWFGADLEFSSHYSTGSILSLRLITK